MRLLCLSFICITILACSKPELSEMLLPQENTESVDTLPQVNFIGEWYHSFEEDYQGEKYYRQSSYDFPVAHVRNSYQLNSDGTATMKKANANDNYDEISGTWEKVGKTIKIKLHKTPMVFLSTSRIYQGLLIEPAAS